MSDFMSNFYHFYDPSSTHRLQLSRANPMNRRNSPMFHRTPRISMFHRVRRETVIIWDAYGYPLVEIEVIREARVYSEETWIIEQTYDQYDHHPNRSHSYNQPSYEEYLELEERMGRVGSRLSEDMIMGHLKLRSYDATSKRMNEEPEICVICQAEYEKDELIGGLQCRHEYHVECVKKWLHQHNSCPICKADAVSLST